MGNDSSVHLAIGRALARGDGFTHPTGMQDAIHPGVPYAVAAGFGVAGPGAVWPVLLFMLGCAGVALACWYRLATRVFGRGQAVVLTLMLGLTEIVYLFSYEVLTDIPFFAGLMLAMLGVDRLREAGRNKAWAVTSGAMVIGGLAWMALFRSVAMVFAVALALSVGWMMLNKAAPGAWWRWPAVAVVALGALLLVRGADPRQDEALGMVHDEARASELVLERPGDTLAKLWEKNLPDLMTESLAEGALGADMGPIASVPLGLLLLGILIWAFRVRPLWGWMGLVFVLQWLLFVVERRYLLVLTPVWVAGWWTMAVWLTRKVPGVHKPRIVMGVVLALWVGPNLGVLVQVVVQQRGPDRKLAALAPMAEALEAQASAEHVVIAEAALPLTYLTDRPVLGSRNLRTARRSERRETRQTLRRMGPVLVVEPIGPLLTQKLEDLQLEPRGVIATTGEGRDLLRLRRYRWRAVSVSPAPEQLETQSE